MRDGILRDAIAAFEAVLQLPEDERARALSEHCGEDHELRRYVSQLLAMDETPHPLLQSKTRREDDLRTPQAPPPSLPGYEIVRQLGEGGMGVVYEAEQEKPRRRVALKVIRGGAYVDEHRVRLFQREVESLARLSHPSVAAIHDAGRTPFGQHFFTMELVEGVSLSEYVGETPSGSGSESRADLTHRLQLFLEICDAVNYAHQRGVIHRDLKPSNVIVVEDATGGTASDGAKVRVKVLDFGLARITDGDVSLATMESEVGKIKGTLAYMSPEQARGDPAAIDVRTDVYSLGVILYELLTGARPYDVQRPLIHEAVRVIQEVTPDPPSAIRRWLRGDLETIVLKALEKDPDRRYGSVAALAEDIRRYLTGQTILARPPSTLYQLNKLVARHRAPVAFGAVVLVLLVASTITIFGLYLRSQREASKAVRTSEFLQTMLSQADPQQAQGREMTVREVLDLAAVNVETELADEPEVKAALQSTIGNAYFSLNRHQEAEELLRESLETRRALLGNDHPELAQTLIDIGAIHFRTRREGQDYFREALRIAEAARRPLLVASAKMWLGNCAPGEDLGGEYLEEAVEIRRRLLGSDDPETMEAVMFLGRWHKYRGNGEEAVELLREVLEYRRRFSEAEPWNQQAPLNLLGVALASIGEYAEARDLFAEEIVLARRIMGQDHLCAVPRLNHANMMLELGDRDAAEASYVELIEDLRAAGRNLDVVGRALHKLARIHRERGDLTSAERDLREVIAIREDRYGSEHPLTSGARISLGVCLGEQGQPAEGRAMVDEALEALLAAVAEAPRVTVEEIEGKDWYREAVSFYESTGDVERLTGLHEDLRSAIRRDDP